MANPFLFLKTPLELYVYLQSKQDGRRCDETICIQKLTTNQDALNFPDFSLILWNVFVSKKTEIPGLYMLSTVYIHKINDKNTGELNNDD